eukprot:2917335-Pleurochrysis_carterae.AAC.1
MLTSLCTSLSATSLLPHLSPLSVSVCIPLPVAPSVHLFLAPSSISLPLSLTPRTPRIRAVDGIHLGVPALLDVDDECLCARSIADDDEAAVGRQQRAQLKREALTRRLRERANAFAPSLKMEARAIGASMRRGRNKLKTQQTFPVLFERVRGLPCVSSRYA